MQISESQLVSLRDLSLQFEVMPLLKQCEEIIERFKLNKKLFDLGKNVEISYPNTWPHFCTSFPSGLPVNMPRLKQLHLTGKYSDVDIYIEGHGLVAQPHRIILGLWSAPFAKVRRLNMCTSVSCFLSLTLIFLVYNRKCTIPVRGKDWMVSWQFFSLGYKNQQTFSRILQDFCSPQGIHSWYL